MVIFQTRKIPSGSYEAKPQLYLPTYHKYISFVQKGKEKKQHYINAEDKSSMTSISVLK